MSEASGYSWADRLLHKAAFSRAGIELQKSLADIEDRSHAAQLDAIRIKKPVFITSLPRAGTTLLLNLVTLDASFVAHTYRTMPFVLCPILWDQVSRGFRKEGDKRERAHADGMLVGYDSPEAFEEVLWKAFWPKKYEKNRIALWSERDRNTEFESFFRRHIQKLIMLAPPKQGLARHYVSKNNANIARIGLLRRIFPDCVLLVPFRDPIDQASSLLRQHRRFLKIHAEDPFARFYMEAIGHYEFGAGLRMLDFPDVAGTQSALDPNDLGFWVQVWVRAFACLAAMPDDWFHLVDFDVFCADPDPGISVLADVLGENAYDALKGEASSFHAAIRYDSDVGPLDPSLLSRARALYEELRARAINAPQTMPERSRSEAR